MKCARYQRMSWYVRWNVGGDGQRNFGRKLARFGEVSQIGGMNDKKKQARNHGDPD
jgi:hypothetical protein